MLEQSDPLQLGELRMFEVRSPTNTARRAASPVAAAAVSVASGARAFEDAALDNASGDGASCAASRARGDAQAAVSGSAASGDLYRATSADVASGDGEFLFVVQLDGASVHYQDERDAKLAAGDFTLCSSARPRDVKFLSAGSYLLVAIPDALMRRHVASPDDLVAVRMSGSRGLTIVLSNFVKTFWTCLTDAIDPAVALRMSYTLLDLIGAAYSTSPHIRHDHSTLVAAHRARITDYIESHLRDPNLNPTSIAHACKITARYLHHLFTSESETVTQYIQRRRLEECARALIATPIRTRLVTEIAFDYGFSSLTHFGRAFRHQFGQSPTEYRRALRD